MSAAPSLQARQLHVQQGGRDVLHDVSLSALPGQWCAIVGPNGAGKSTLLRTLAGLQRARTGDVLLKGRPVLSYASQERARALAWLAQQHGEEQGLSVRDTVALGRLPYQGWWGMGGVSSQDESAIDQALIDTDLEQLQHRRMQALSGGERQRAWLARALAVQAPVLLFDEPGAHLDAPHQRLLARVLQREARKGGAVLSVLHELPLALMADQLVVMEAGRIVEAGPVGEAHVHAAVETVFKHAIEIVNVHGRWTVVPQL